MTKALKEYDRLTADEDVKKQIKQRNKEILNCRTFCILVVEILNCLDGFEP